ncbi:MAG: glycosyltransferase family 2 protein [Cyanobacteriota bacterium]|nr:glycosyltransferase family 2 protein [Cyanobacteriota bacterium]
MPQPIWKVRRLLTKKLENLHPVYSQGMVKKRTLSQQWRDYNHLLSRKSFPLVGYDEWIERIESPAIHEQERHLASAASSIGTEQPIPKFAIWLWGDRDDAQLCQASIESLEKQLPGQYELLPDNHQLRGKDRKTWIVFLQTGDQLPPHSLKHFAFVIQAHQEAGVLYADEDRITAFGRRHSPQFKPAWNPDLLYSDSFYSHSWVIRADYCLRACKALSNKDEEPSLYALALEVTAKCKGDQILHLPEILYHRLDRSKESRSSAQTAAILEAFFARHQNPLRVTFHQSGGHAVHWPLSDPPPLVSIIIPTRDHANLLRCCLTSLAEHSHGNPPTEIILIDNGSSEPDTLEYLNTLGQQQNVRILRRPGSFNYAALNNEAVTFARGELLALMNNDVEATHSGWLSTMAAHALRADIGAVGAKLMFDDGTIQHAGVLLGIGGVAGHAHKYLDAQAEGYQLRLQLTHNVSAVTAATLVIRREVFLEVGGFDAENFQVNYNDVDLCLRLLMAGYRNLYCPDAVLIHHESKSRGAPSTPEAYSRWQLERQAMVNRWGKLLEADPNYSPHLSLHEENLSLALRPYISGARQSRPTPI